MKSGRCTSGQIACLMRARRLLGRLGPDPAGHLAAQQSDVRAARAWLQMVGSSENCKNRDVVEPGGLIAELNRWKWRGDRCPHTVRRQVAKACCDLTIGCSELLQGCLVMGA